LHLAVDPRVGALERVDDLAGTIGGVTVDRQLALAILALVGGGWRAGIVNLSQ